MDSTAQFSPCLQAQPQRSMKDTCHMLHCSNFQKRLRSEEQGMVTAQQPSGRRRRLGRLGWSGRSLTSQVLQAKHPYQRTKGWFKRQGHSPTRNKGSCTDTQQRAKNQLGTPKAEGQNMSRITLLKGVFHGNHIMSARDARCVCRSGTSPKE